MPTREFYGAMLAVLVLASVTRAQAQSPYGIGRPATPAEIAGWNIDIDRDGNNLPPGSGSVSHGREVFDQQCASLRSHEINNLRSACCAKVLKVAQSPVGADLVPA
jgi:hypothetical protein